MPMTTRLLATVLLLACASVARADKSVYIPTQFQSAPWNEWSWDKSYQSENFFIVWGNRAGSSPATNPVADLRFDPAAIAGYLEATFATLVTKSGFVSNDSTTNLGRYRIIVVMNETYEGAGGPTGWAFGGQYDNTIGALWVHPNATRDPYVLSHELTHALQAQNGIDRNQSGGFIGFEPAGWFWECHANYMRSVEFPRFAADDMPRWLATRSFHLSSTRHHYSAFRWLMHIQQSHGGIAMVNRLWHESAAGEDPIMTLRRLKGWSQKSLNDFMYDYASREVVFDYPAQAFGDAMRDMRNSFRSSAAENHYLWRYYTMLERIDPTTGRYTVPGYSAPQDYGINIIPLHPTCSTRTVHVKFRGHTEAGNGAGWRWGFVAAGAADSTARYGPLSDADQGEATFTLLPEERLYLVVVGAPTSHTSYVWEPGWPKLRRHPYELRIENALPEGFDTAYRADLRALFPGYIHVNGGGWVDSNATVAPSVFVAPRAVVLGRSRLSGDVRVEGTARLERVTASGAVVFADEAHAVGGTYRDSVTVDGRAILYDCTANGTATIGESALAWGVSYASGVVVGGDAELGSCSTPGVYLQTPHPNNGREACDGRGAGDISNVDLNGSHPRFSESQMSWTPIGCDAAAAVESSTAGGADLSVGMLGDEGVIIVALEGWDPEESVMLRIVDLAGRELLVDRLDRRRTVTYPATIPGMARAGYLINAWSLRRSITRKIIGQ